MSSCGWAADPIPDYLTFGKRFFQSLKRGLGEQRVYRSRSGDSHRREDAEDSRHIGESGELAKLRHSLNGGSLASTAV